MDNAQLAMENAAKSVVARFTPVPRTHAAAALLDEHLGRGLIPEPLRPAVEQLRDLGRELGYEEHIRSDDGEEARGLTPWELFGEPEAARAIEVARQAVRLAEELTLE